MKISLILFSNWIDSFIITQVFIFVLSTLNLCLFYLLSLLLLGQPVPDFILLPLIEPFFLLQQYLLLFLKRNIDQLEGVRNHALLNSFVQLGGGGKTRSEINLQKPRFQLLIYQNIYP